MSIYLNSGSDSSMVAQLARLGTELALSNQRLSTAQRINQASDDPSGVVAVAQYDQTLAEIEATTRNGERIQSMIETADGAMSQIASLVGTIQSNALLASGSTVTAEQRSAYQAEIDAAVDAIDTIVNTTTFNDERLLDGSIGYRTSGVDSAKLADVRVNSANTSGGSVSLEVALASAAEKAVVSYSNGNLTDDVTLSLTGNNGTEAFTFASGSTISDLETAINAQSDATGVEAEVDGGTLHLRSSDYGSAQSVSVNVTAGTFAMDGAVTSDTGVDATVTVNGQSATADGLQVYFSGGDTSVRLSLQESFGTGAPASTTFSVTGGGANWALNANPANAIRTGLSSLNSSFLGNDTLGYLSSLKSGGANALSSGNYQQAANIASKASSLVAADRARLGAVSTYTVGATLSALSSTQAAVTDARSSIMDVDYAAETANNNRLQVLMEATTSLLGGMSGSANTVLSLLATL